MAYVVTVLLLKRSILTEKIARRGHHITREYHADPFEFARVAEVMTRDVQTMDAGMTVGQAVAFFTTTERRHTSYPVVDADKRLVGLVSRADSLAWTVENVPEETLLVDALQTRSLQVAYPDELAGRLADRMAATDVGRVPVIDRRDGRLVGLVGRKDLMRVRARRLAEERERAVYLSWRDRGTARR